MKKKLALAVAVVFCWSVIAPVLAYSETPAGRVSPTNTKKAFATSASTKRSIAGVFSDRKLTGAKYKSGQLIIKVKDKALLKGQLESKWKLKVEKKLMDDMVLVSFDTGKKNIESMMNDLNSSEAIYFAEPNYLRAHAGAGATAAATATDLTAQWGLDASDTQAAWDITQGLPSVIVGVIDSGVDYDHTDLTANIYKNTGETAGDGIDNDGNGYIDDVRGYDFGEGDSDPMDNVNHGTHISGIIAAADNSFGVTGVAPKVRILPLKVTTNASAVGFMSTSAIIEAIVYGSEMGVKLFNCSYGDSVPDPAEYDAIQASTDSLFISAAGNGDENGKGLNTDISPYYPADYELDNIISVAALTNGDQLTTFSNYGMTTVDIAAPGEGIYSTIRVDEYGRRSRYGFMSGTSIAVPFVVGAAALMLSVNPNMPVLTIKEKILSSAIALPALDGKDATGGKLDVNEAVNMARLDVPDVTGIEISRSTLALYTDTSGKLTAALLPMRTHSRSVEWTSSAPGIVTVDAAGNLRAISKGVATITATIPATDTTTSFAAGCVVTVTNFKPPVLKPGASRKLTFKIPEFIDTHYGSARVWLIRPDGTEGSFALTQDYMNGTFYATIRADNDGVISSTDLDPFKYYGTWEVEMLEMNGGDDVVHNYYNDKYFDPEDPDSETMSLETHKFIVSDNLHSDVDTSFKNVNNSMDKTLSSPIVYSSSTVSTRNAYQGNWVTFKVFSKARVGIYSAYITFIKPNGKELELFMNINPRGGFYYCNMYVSRSSISGIYNAVSENYNLEGVNDAGLWKIKGIELIDTSYDKYIVTADLSALAFTVQNKYIKATKILYEKTLIYTKKGKVIKPRLVFAPANVSQKTMTYSSSNSLIAYVNRYGIVTAKKPGTVTIKATAKDGSGLSAKVKIIVK